MSSVIADTFRAVRDEHRKPSRHLLHAVVGGLCGVVATGPMTALMTLWHRQLPAWERYPLPPRQITMNLARRAGIAGDLDEDARSTATILAHFGYGAAAGVVYSGLARRTGLGMAARGLAFGALVWIISYLGLLPGTGLLNSAMRHPQRRNVLMFSSHLVWGLVLSGLEEVLRPRSQWKSPGPRKL